MSDTTANDVARYRDERERRALRSAVFEWLDSRPVGDLPLAEHALAAIRRTMQRQTVQRGNDQHHFMTRVDVRHAAGRFYVLGPGNVWVIDEDNSRVAALLHDWARSESYIAQSLVLDMDAAYTAAEKVDDDAFLGWHGEHVQRLRRAVRDWQRKVSSLPVRERIVADLRVLTRLESPEVFDANPDVIAAANGLVSLVDGSIRSIQPGDYVTQRLAVEYDPDALAPRWTRFLEEILVDDQGSTDAELVEWVQRLVGYGITGHASAQVFAVLHGKGANGKTKFVEALQHVFGPITRSADMSTFEYRPNGGAASGDLARLAGARLVVTSESEVGARLSASTIKRITGEDVMTARFLYREAFEFRPRFLLLMMTNTRPVVLDNSEGFWRRVKLIEFRRYFALHERDDTLANRLRDEAAGILAWAVRGAVAWRSFGLGSTAAIDDSVYDYRPSQDRLGEFIDEALLVSGDDHDRITTADAWQAYVEWAEATHSRDSMLKKPSFFEALGERVGRARKVTGIRRFHGVRALTEVERRRRALAAERA